MRQTDVRQLRLLLQRLQRLIRVALRQRVGCQRRVGRVAPQGERVAAVLCDIVVEPAQRCLHRRLTCFDLAGRHAGLGRRLVTLDVLDGLADLGQHGPHQGDPEGRACRGVFERDDVRSLARDAQPGPKILPGCLALGARQIVESGHLSAEHPVRESIGHEEFLDQGFHPLAGRTVRELVDDRHLLEQDRAVGPNLGADDLRPIEDIGDTADADRHHRKRDQEQGCVLEEHVQQAFQHSLAA